MAERNEHTFSEIQMYSSLLHCTTGCLTLRVKGLLKVFVIIKIYDGVFCVEID